MAKEDPAETASVISDKAPSEVRRTDSTPLHQIRLERVLGVTVSSNAAVDVSSSDGLVAYPAGCTVVLYNPKKNRQTHLLNTCKKSITSLRFSADGRFLVTGECGHQPAVRVWNVAEKTLLQEFLVHKYGITCVGFSPGNKYVVSVGFQHDMIVNVWDWQRNVKVASNKVSSRVKAVSFAENGCYFVTVGNRHVKFWYLELSRSSKYKEAMPLTGRSAILGEQRNNHFCDVACGRGEMGDSTYAITRSGLLCEFNNRRLLDKWVELRTTTANCMVAGESLIFIGCADGIVRCFSPLTLQFVTTLPRTHYLGVDLARGLAISHMAAHPAGSRYPDCVGVTYDETAQKVTCFYNDHSIYVWDVRDISKVGKSHSFLYHSACIWGVETSPQVEGLKSVLPVGSFITCSSDDTIRIWNLDPHMPNNTVYKRNIYSNDLLKILYIDPALQYLKDVEPGAREAADKSDPGYDCKNGVRCIKISPDGKHLASGDRQGNIRVHELQFMDELCKIEAHDAEVLCLEYSQPSSGWKLLSSASRDRLIHLFNADQEYQFLQTLDDHSSSITAVRFFQNQDRLYMVSCGADKSVIFRHATLGPDRSLQFTRSHNVVGKTTLYDMEVDHSQRHILTACQDRNVRVYNCANGKHSKTFKGSITDDGTLIKLSMDQSGIYVATSCTDKTLYVYDYYSGECMASMFGHSELVTGLRFTDDCRHLITVSGDGCVFVWKVPHDMTQTMLARLQQQARRSRRRQTHSMPPAVDTDSRGSPDDQGLFDANANERDDADYRFPVGGLPQWAKRKVAETSPSPTNERTVDFPKGRWAQRIDSTGMTVKSIYDRDSVIPFPADRRRGGTGDSEGSKDSSLEDTNNMTAKESGRTSRAKENGFSSSQHNLRDLLTNRNNHRMSRSTRRLDIIETRNRPLTDDSSDIGSYRPDDVTTDHDGDIDDYSEPESMENGAAETPMYYPQSLDDGAGSPFTVNAMDQEELRRSVRRSRRQRPTQLSITPLPPSSDAGTATQEESDLEEDEEDVSTPSADTDGQQRLGHHVSASMESLDKAAERGQFLTKNFESLDGGDESPLDGSMETPHKNSISSKFLGRSYQANIVRSQESLKKREELQRRIQETRRKLQDIGAKSSLTSSQSIADLSFRGLSPGGASGGGGGGGDYARRGSGAASTNSRAKPHAPGAARKGSGGSVDLAAAAGDGGLRRAVSLSDLTDANTPRRLLPTTPAVSGKKVSGKKARPSSALARSSSMNYLNQTDSDSGLSRSTRAVGSPMRPTIASLGKQKAPPAGAPSYRRSMTGAASAGDVRTLDPDSSSEDMLSPTESPSHLQLKARSGSQERSAASRLKAGATNGRASAERELGHGKSPARDASGRLTATVTKTRQQTVTRRSTVTLQGYEVRESSPEDVEWDGSVPTAEHLLGVDASQLPLTREVCESALACLRRSADQVLQLAQRLAEERPPGASELPHLLRQGASQSLATLRPLAAAGAAPPLTKTSTSGSLPELLAGQQADPLVVHMMQQYGDAFISMMEQRMQPPPPPPG